MSVIPRSASVVASAVLLTVLAGCGAQGDATGSTTGTNTSTPSGAAANDGMTPNLMTPVEELPFAQFTAAVTALSNDVDSSGVGADVFASREAFVADCMATEGFTYTAALFSEPGSVSHPWLESAIPVPELPAERGAVAARGYGQDDPTRVDVDQDIALPGQGDPDADYIDALSDQDVTAYMAALTGSRGPDDAIPAEDGGCRGRSEAAFPTGSDGSDSPALQFESLTMAMQKLVQRDIYTDQAVVDLNEEWVGCMAEAGHDVGAPAEYPAPSVPGPMQGWNLAVITGADGMPHWPELGRATSDLPVVERSLIGTEAEHAIAVADFDCRAETDYVGRFTDALRSAQEEFVDQRGDELAAMDTPFRNH